MSDLREALDNILLLCHGARTYTRRTQQINEVAMKALGMTQGQRLSRHMAIFDRVGDNPGKQAFLDRKAKRDARMEMRESREPDEAAPAGLPAGSDAKDALGKVICPNLDARGQCPLPNVHCAYPACTKPKAKTGEPT